MVARRRVDTRQKDDEVERVARDQRQRRHLVGANRRRDRRRLRLHQLRAAAHFHGFGDRADFERHFDRPGGGREQLEIGHDRRS